MTSSTSEDSPGSDSAISCQQRAAAAAPDRGTGELVGNFADFERLFEQLAEPALMELGKPLPMRKYMPKTRLGSCPATHNRALLRDDGPI